MHTNTLVGFILAGFLIPFSVQATPLNIQRQALSVYTSHPFTFLYEIPFTAQGKIQTALCAQCPPQEVTVQWMAIIPANAYLNDRMCFKEKLCIDSKGARFGGIRCCRKRDPLFKQFENDLHHLVPELPSLKKMLHQKIKEPQDKLKGEIARMFLYMHLKYKINLSTAEKIRYEGWHRKYPPTHWERQKNQIIKNIQGDHNPYVQ